MRFQEVTAADFWGEIEGGPSADMVAGREVIRMGGGGQQGDRLLKLALLKAGYTPNDPARAGEESKINAYNRVISVLNMAAGQLSLIDFCGALGIDPPTPPLAGERKGGVGRLKMLVLGRD